MFAAALLSISSLSPDSPPGPVMIVSLSSRLIPEDIRRACRKRGVEFCTSSFAYLSEAYLFSFCSNGDFDDVSFRRSRETEEAYGCVWVHCRPWATIPQQSHEISNYTGSRP
ncbi:hypothetical protein M422DRAFT_276671 [Sphaerobolus stellatus SS14]|uniref:Uncharacterized protein n=1 Tax=Sphaerobolus stellatus (strain SS14) TaxID=990650 RepID=A0A0C9T232_SPHS4|nr:hypothetical protein M422DRAFT_276671 [Sphaerobolus stellatus SS14]